MYGVNYGTLGFLMNRAATARDPETARTLLASLPDRVAAADPVTLTPLRADAVTVDVGRWTRWAFNEVAVRRTGPQAACLRKSPHRF